MRIRQYIPRASAFCMLLLTTLAVRAQEENLDTIFDIHHILGYLVAGFLITVFVMVFYNRLIFYREKVVVQESERLSAQLSLILASSNTEVWTYDIKNDTYSLLTEAGKKELTYTPFEFLQFFERHDFADMMKAIDAVKNKETLSETLIVKNPPPKEGESEEEHPRKIYEVTISILRRDAFSNPIVLLGTQRDITKEQRHAEETKALALRYQTVFTSSLVDMFYYDADGILADFNDKAGETFGIKNRGDMLRRHLRFNDFPAFRHFDIQTLEHTHISSVTDIQKVKMENERMPEVTRRGKMYYESVVGPIRDKNNKLRGIVAAGRDVTEMVESNHHQKEASLLIEKRTKEIQGYIQNINYSLRVSEVRLMNYYPDSHELEISNNLNTTQYKLPQLRAIVLIHPEDRPKARRLVNRMDRRKHGTISETLRTILRDKKGRDIYLNFDVMPILDKEGHITHYFGMCRNETEVTHTEMKLQEETEKAQEEEKLKNTFLLNMSYELRTPLNAVIGFAELFNMEHNEEDEPVFAEEIKKNTGILLALINDILFLSRLDAHMIEYNYEYSDFAMLFDGWCYMGWSNITPDVKAVVENPYSSLIVNIDQQNLGMAIQKLCIYSSLSTKKGTVRAKYEYHHGELVITIEDTGRGMSAEQIKTAFNRFAREEGGDGDGTGLDLPIVKELLGQMNGTIELQSEPGKGSTFFVSIPCEMETLVKKQNL